MSEVQTPGSRRLMLAAFALVSIAAAYAGYRQTQNAGASPSYEEQCASLCKPLSSRVEKKYVDPMSPKSQRNMPHEVLCMCGSSVLGKPML